MPGGGRPAADLLVALVVTPLLVVMGLLLQSNLQGDWTDDPQRRWNVLGLGLGLLCVSLLMCCYVTHRLGICIWEAQHRSHPPAQVEVLVPQEAIAAVGSQVQLVVRADPPPSYESVASCDCDTPPPYCAVVVYGQAAVSVAPSRPQKPPRPA